MSKTLIYSCVAGNYEDATKGVLSSKAPMEKDVAYIFYTDQKIKNAVQIDQNFLQYRAPNGNILWQIKPLVWKHPFCKRRTARFCKINPHIFCGDDITHTIWMDGTQVIKEDMELAKNMLPLLENNFIAAFKHYERICVYQELRACLKLKKDNSTLMRQQIAKYQKDKYPAYNGLVETGCLIRKQVEEAAEFNTRWWEEITHNSYRDQLSFNYVMWKYNQKYSLIPEQPRKCKFFHHVPHPNR